MVIAASLAAPWLAPNDPNTRFSDLTYAPPTRVHLSGDESVLYFYAPRLINRLERRFEEDRARQVPVRFLRDGRLLSADRQGGAPLLLLGADGYGRDIFSRLLFGGRATLAVAALATLGATLLGALIGGRAGQAARGVGAAVARVAGVPLGRPASRVALALRGGTPSRLPA